MRRLLPLLFVLLLSTPLLGGTSAAGRWDGSIALPSMKLDVQVDLEESAGVWKGDITIPLQQARDLPLTAVSVDGTSVVFSIAGVPGNPTFKGTLEGDRLSGQFTQSGATFAFELVRGTKAEAAASVDAIDDLVRGALASWQVPGLAVAVVADGKVAWAKGYGLRDVAGGKPMTADTLLPIGSVTKSFTTTVLGILVDEGTLGWDRPLRTWLPDFVGPDETLTAHLTPRDLVTHRSGLPRHDLVWYNNQDLTRRQIVSRLAHLAPNKELREGWQYNNLMFLTAGVLVEQLTGRSWEEALRARVFEPLGMKRSTFSDAESTKDADFAKPYREHDDRLEEIPFREVGNMGPAGSVNSSASEMARYALFHLQNGTIDGKQLVQPSTMTELHTPQSVVPRPSEYPDISSPSYAMGWFVDSYRAHRRVYHGGNIDGFSAQLTLFPDDGVAVVALANADGTALPSVVTNHIADRILKLEARDWNGQLLAKRAMAKSAAREAAAKKTVTRKSGTKPSHALADYAGDYENPGYGVVRIERAAPDRLQATYNRIVTPLEHWHYEVFNGTRNDKDPTFEDMKYLFRSDLAGNVSALEVPFEPFVAPIVFTKNPDAKLSDPGYLRQFLGDYQLGPQTISVALRGTRLVLTIAGQPPYTLTPDIEGWFELDGLTGYRLRFAGKTMELSQPNGLFTATKK